MKSSSTSGREAVRSGVDPDVLFQILRSFLSFPRSIAELISNGLDWRVNGSSPEISVRYVNDGDEINVEVTDQGRGADAKGRRYLTSLGRSAARELGGMRGQKGSGSKSWIWHCRYVTIETVPEPGTLYRVKVTVEKLLEWLFGTGVGNTDAWEVVTKPGNHPVRATGTRIILHGLGADNGQTYKKKPMVSTREDRSPARLIAELAECLAPNVDRFITVTDEKNVSHRLAARRIEGEPIIGESLGVPGVGDMSWDVAVVANRQAGIDALRIGALGTYVTWQEFVRLVRRNTRYRTLLAPLDQFWDPRLSGYIEVTGLNDHRSTSSEAFDADVGEDEELVEGALVTLIERMLPGVQEALKNERPTVTSDVASFLSGIAGVIQSATGVIPMGGPTRHVSVTKRRTSIMLERGDQYEIEIKADHDTRVVWDDSDSGGTMTPKRGPKGTYTAGTACGDDYTLVARNVADATQVLYEVKVRIVPEIPFAFSKPIYRMDTNDRVVVSIDERALRRTSGDIVIQVAKKQSDGAPHDVRLEHDGTHRASVASGCTEGFVEIEAFDRNNPGNFHAWAKVSIERGLRDRPKQRSPLDLEFVYDGRRYMLAASMYSGYHEALRQVSYLTPGEEASTITLNLDHPLFDGKADVVRAESALWQIAMRVVDHVSHGLSVEEMVQESGVIYAHISRPQAS
ncbi:hypothetical protein A2348_01890 [Candidatus Uhrbacteria bacterium RIFOXYB12_FULL_58_10]|uniref:Histidine kinase/HSP90-like ATPase domain-containing protein n=1 Tax=Candidatus Uhrbacteria bacterium RIFOXYB2_FULL_57_15 TaxID=1802422 RepID=A0A1F7WAV7_9BACT|nr:MAG: hypothetical protein A2348_01890 [Candidatus Uhrbacteria bacterium RIFOXYB12_FULL_58_10]OGL99347.1 MAG: hypothetical protein A2304_00010 [Candidatus Uhrbacteria bacterium RIFOXYB2_FULL_57_15]OGM00478.1 MAG: hypothetical protein A2501_00760 [Candidatus Uhrbacteria bacterium RIFOXYC12_FULL_57_11]